MPKHSFQADGEALPDATIFLAVTPSMRLRLETTIENLLVLLDEIDGDPDQEDVGDMEPNLGWTDRPTASMIDTDEREEVSEDEGAQCDDEGQCDYDEPGFIWGGGEEGKGVKL